MKRDHSPNSSPSSKKRDISGPGPLPRSASEDQDEAIILTAYLRSLQVTLAMHKLDMTLLRSALQMICTALGLSIPTAVKSDDELEMSRSAVMLYEEHMESNTHRSLRDYLYQDLTGRCIMHDVRLLF